MKNRALHSIVLVIALLLLVGCGEGETVVFASFKGSTNQDTGEGTDRTSEQSSGLVVIVITDAEPVLPSGTEEVWITVKEVLIHREGGVNAKNNHFTDDWLAQNGRSKVEITSLNSHFSKF